MWQRKNDLSIGGVHIKFTDEQQVIVDEILDRVTDSGLKKNLVISGKGGVGKTEMITEVVTILLKEGFKVAVSAMTGKATAVLRQKIQKKLWDKRMVFYTENDNVSFTFPKENLKIETIQKLTKESKVVSIDESGKTVYSNTWIDPKKFDYDVLIVDELSMVPHYIGLWWQKTSALVIGLGDYCQLPEVMTQESRKEIDGFKHDLGTEPGRLINGYGIKALKNLSELKLTKILRADNEIAFLSNDLREFEKSNKEIVNTFKKWAEKAPEVIQYTTDLRQLEMDDDWQILCYTNKLCGQINKALCKGGDYPVEDDKILLYDNIPPIQKFNGDTMTLKELIKRIRDYNSSPKHILSPLTVVLKWKNQMPSLNSKHKLDREMAAQYQLYKESIKKAQITRLKMLPGILDRSGYSKIQVDEWKKEIQTIRKEEPDAGEAFTKIITRFYEVDRDIAESIMDQVPQLPRVYIVHIDYGYAITVHKSQGSEYAKVCYILEKFDKPLIYTGVSRAKEKLKVINMTNIK